MRVDIWCLHRVFHPRIRAWQEKAAEVHCKGPKLSVTFGDDEQEETTAVYLFGVGFLFSSNGQCFLELHMLYGMKEELSHLE